MALNRFRVARELDSYVVLDLGDAREGGMYVHDDAAVVVGDRFPFTADGKGQATAIAAGLNASHARTVAEAVAEAAADQQQAG